MKQGVYYDISEKIYHDDPCVTPSLSSSIIKPLLYESPWHAWHKHPKLNPNFEPENKTTFDEGRAAHAIILGEEQNFVIIDAKDWRTNAAKEQRDAAYADGKTPLLQHQFDEVKKIVDAHHAQIKNHECSDAFVGGKSEVTIVWQEDNGIWCRCRVDHIAENGKNFYDYKTTDQTANPDSANRMMFNLGYDITAAFYNRGIRKVLGVEPNYRFVIQEKELPYALSVIALDPAAEGVAQRKVDEAVRLWGECLQTGKWPGYPNRIAYVGAPAYIEQQWLEREARESAKEA